MDYAIIRVGNKQHRVRDGETLVVDRVSTEAGKTFTPEVLLGDGKSTVTVKVVAHERGPKIRIGKYRKRTGYKRHNGFRAATSRIEVAIGTGKRAAAKPAAPKAAHAETDVAATEAVATPEAAVETPEPAAAPKAAAEKPAGEADEKLAAPKGLPAGYAKLTVAAIVEGVKTWHKPQLVAALEYEQEHAKRKGAIAALEHALAATEGSH
jgi:large subunit ribosomal protein L21